MPTVKRPTPWIPAIWDGAAGEEVPGELPADNARAFAARVTYQGTDEPEILRLLAVGVEPMWIFGREHCDNTWKHDGRMKPANRAREPAGKP